MTPVAWLDEIGKPAWIALMIVSFFVCWPLGLVVLGFTVGSGRMFRCWNSRRGGEWRQRMQEQAAQWCGPRASGAESGRDAQQRQPRLRRIPRRDAAPP